MSSNKIIASIGLLGIAIFGGVRAVSFYNKAKNAINNIQFMFSFVRVQGLIGEGITKFTNPNLQVVFELQIKNLSDFNVNVTNVVATIQNNKNNDWNTIAQSDTQFSINAPAKGGISKITVPINFKGLTTLSAIANVKSNYRCLITYQYKGTALQHTQDIPLQQYIKLAIDNLKAGLNLKGVEQKTNLALVS